MLSLICRFGWSRCEVRSRARSLPHNKASIKLLDMLPRHLFSDSVFWNSERVQNHFQEDIDSFLGEFTLEEYRRRFAGMIFVEKSSKEFIRAFNKQILKLV